MADEFVDFYEALNLSMEADRKEVRRRINEVYLEAQRNLDHRNFQTRVKHQEMFEVVLPRARYILLDEGRRDDYDRLVKAFRGASAAPVAPVPAPSAPVKPSFGSGDASSFRLAEEASEGKTAGKAPPVGGIPTSTLDAAQMAAQRDEMWAKWKQGLESAIARDESEPKPVKAAAPATDTVSPQTPAPKPSAENGTARKPRPQASSISFNFGENSSGTQDDEESARAAAFELERQKAERKRVIMKDILATVAMKGAMMGGIGAAVILGAFLIFFMGHFYPRGAAPQLPVPSTVAWLLGIAIVGAGAYFGATSLSQTLRSRAAVELAVLPLEELLRKVGRSY